MSYAPLPLLSFILFCTLLFPSEVYDRYIEVYIDKKWQVLDLKERKILDLKIYKYYPNFLITQRDNKYGVLTDSGVNISPQYNYIEENILRKYASFLLQSDVKNHYDYEDKVLIRVKKNGIIGLINLKGRWIFSETKDLKILPDFTPRFSTGLTVSVFDNRSFLRYIINNKTGFLSLIDSGGKNLLDKKYNYLLGVPNTWRLKGGTNTLKQKVFTGYKYTPGKGASWEAITVDKDKIARNTVYFLSNQFFYNYKNVVYFNKKFGVIDLKLNKLKLYDYKINHLTEDGKFCYYYSYRIQRNFINTITGKVLKWTTKHSEQIKSFHYLAGGFFISKEKGSFLDVIKIYNKKGEIIFFEYDLGGISNLWYEKGFTVLIINSTRVFLNNKTGKIEGIKPFSYEEIWRRNRFFKLGEYSYREYFLKKKDFDGKRYFKKLFSFNGEQVKWTKKYELFRTKYR